MNYDLAALYSMLNKFWKRVLMMNFFNYFRPEFRYVYDFYTLTQLFNIEYHKIVINLPSKYPQAITSDPKCTQIILLSQLFFL